MGMLGLIDFTGKMQMIKTWIPDQWRAAEQ